MTLREIIVSFMEKQKNCVATLSEIYKAIDNSEYVSNSDTVHDSARAIIYRHKNQFKRVCKGIYMLVGEKSASLLIEGDGRKLDEIEDGSIDCIITDHPWEDKKAHRSGNQKSFADYNTFEYKLEDFKQKARVLKDGAYLCEFLPIESATNWKYLEEIKHMAEDCGLQYYTQCIWRNAPEGTINTGKTTKGVQQLLIFTKGKPRKLSRKGVNAYQTKEILKYEIEVLLKNKDKVHQAEKPVELYEYLISQFTEENDVCLDQFAGSCNMLKAATNLNRFSICYELCHDFVVKAKERLNAIPLYVLDASNESVERVSDFTKEIGNRIYKLCLELAKNNNWKGNIEELLKFSWIKKEYIDICLKNDNFCSMLKKHGIVLTA